jgi:leader peptidase (prepilin peptidase)/N-methyltransferase
VSFTVADAAALPELAIAGFAALVGATVGSFLNVVIARVPQGLSIVRPRSRCPRCGAPIAWHDNVPLVSWVLLRARCRACRAPIPWRYPLVELLGAVAGAASVLRHGPSLASVVELAFVALLVALAFIDLDTWLLPHALTWPVIGLGVVGAALGAGAAPSLRASLAGAGAGWLGFAAVSVVGARVLRKEALGFGDVWLLSGLGAFFGIGGLLPLVLLASVQGSVAGLVLLALGKHERGPEVAPPPEGGQGDGEAEWVPPRHAIPLGPFLALAAVEWLYGARWLAAVLPGLDVFL